MNDKPLPPIVSIRKMPADIPEELGRLLARLDSIEYPPADLTDMKHLLVQALRASRRILAREDAEHVARQRYVAESGRA